MGGHSEDTRERKLISVRETGFKRNVHCFVYATFAGLHITSRIIEILGFGVVVLTNTLFRSKSLCQGARRSRVWQQ